MPFIHLLAILYLVTSAVSETPTRYDGFTVLRAYPQTMVALDYLHSLERVLPGMQIWQLSRKLGSAADVMVAPGAMRQEMEKKLVGASIQYEVMIENVQELIDTEQQEMQRASETTNMKKAINLETFNGFDTIMSWLEEMATQYPYLSTVESIGSSFEGRVMKLIKIGTNANNPAVWIDGGIHAREWLSPATVMWFINKLLTQYHTSSSIKKLVDSLNWYILPVHNPDGYEFSRNSERLWRKTRTPTDASSFWLGPCYGADPNRNWDNNWGTTGISHNGCSDVYCGQSPHSEPCVKNVVDYIMARKSQFVLYLSLHTYGQLWLMPYSYTWERVANYEELSAAAGDAVTALQNVYGTSYESGQVPHLLYEISGSSVDWAYDSAGIKFSYLVELRDTGRYGFVAPASEIRATGEETWAAVVSLVNRILPQIV